MKENRKDKAEYPGKWEDLTPEQKARFQQWYDEQWEKKEKEKKKAVALQSLASFFGLTPFVAGYAYVSCKGELSWEFLWIFACAFIVYGIVHTLAAGSFIHFAEYEIDEWSKIGKVWFYIRYVLAASALTLWFMHKVNWIR